MLIAAVGSGIITRSFSIFFLPLKRDLVVSSAAVSLLYGAARLEGGVEGPIVGRLIDRFGPKPLILGGTALAGVGFILLSMVNSFLAFFLIYVLLISLGFNGGFYTPVYTAVNSWFIRRRGMSFALIDTAGNVGTVVMAPVLSYLIINFGWRTAALVSGLIILAVAVPAAIPISRSPEARGLRPDGAPAPGARAPDSGPSKPMATEVDFTPRQALGTLNYWLLTLSISLRLIVTIALLVHMVPILVWKGMTEVSAAYLLSLFGLASIVVTLAMGWMGDRWSKPLLCAMGALASVVGLLGLTLSQASVALYAFPIALAVTMGSTPLNWALIGDFFGRASYATLRGIMQIGIGIVTFLSPVYAGWVFDRTGSYTTVFITYTIILIMAAALFATLRRPSPPPARELSMDK